MTSISIDDVKRDLAGFLQKVEAGEAFVIVQGDKPIAELKPASPRLQAPVPSDSVAKSFVYPTISMPRCPKKALANSRRMRLLLDTHVFLWYISGDTRLPRRLRDELRNPENDVWLSVVSVWEAIVKYQLKKLPLPEPPESYLPKQRERHQIQSLSLDEASVTEMAACRRSIAIRSIEC